MPSPVTLERYVGPALYVHAQGDVIVYEGSFVAGHVIPCHVHADPVISLVLEGDGVEDVAGRTRLVTSQDLLLTPAYALHGYRFGRSGRWFNMQLTDAWLARSPTALRRCRVRRRFFTVARPLRGLHASAPRFVTTTTCPASR